MLNLYTEKNIWSPRYKGWAKYFIKKPRLPTNDDKTVRWVDLSSNKPLSLGSMQGKHNDSVLKSLGGIRENFEDSRALPPAIIITGPSGSGKTTIVQKFVEELVEDLNLPLAFASKFFLEVNVRHYTSNFNILFNKITQFIEPTIEKSVSTQFRVVFVDDVDIMPPSSQQKLKKIMESHALRTRWIFVAKDISKLIQYIQSVSVSLRTKSISEKDGLNVVLNICYRNRIGYDRDGMKALFNACNNQLSLSYVIDLLQKVFVTYYFISENNVLRIHRTSHDIPTISSTTAVEPLSRCSICTLIPPCKHISIESISDMGVKRREELPRNRGSLRCDEFICYGKCSIFNRNKTCPFDHPKDVHNLSYPKPRCAQCTLVWPCNHCNYTKSRLKLFAAIEEIQQRLYLLKLLSMIEPPPNLIVNLSEDYPEWNEKIQELNVKFIETSKDDIVTNSLRWYENSLTVNKEEYKMRERLLRLHFDEILSTEMLDKSYLTKKRENKSKKSQKEKRFESDGDDESDYDDDDDDDDDEFDEYDKSQRKSPSSHNHSPHLSRNHSPNRSRATSPKSLNHPSDVGTVSNMLSKRTQLSDSKPTSLHARTDSRKSRK